MFRVEYNLRRHRQMLNPDKKFKQDLLCLLKKEWDAKHEVKTFWFQLSAVKYSMVALVILIVLASISTGAYAYVSPNVTEGTKLYGVKMILEKTEENFARTPEKHAELLLKQVKMREAERIVMFRRGQDTTSVEKRINNLDLRIENISQSLPSETNDQEFEKILIEIKLRLERRQMRLEEQQKNEKVSFLSGLDIGNRIQETIRTRLIEQIVASVKSAIVSIPVVEAKAISPKPVLRHVVVVRPKRVVTTATPTSITQNTDNITQVTTTTSTTHDTNNTTQTTISTSTTYNSTTTTTIVYGGSGGGSSSGSDTPASTPTYAITILPPNSITNVTITDTTDATTRATTNSSATTDSSTSATTDTTTYTTTRSTTDTSSNATTNALTVPTTDVVRSSDVATPTTDTQLSPTVM